MPRRPRESNLIGQQQILNEADKEIAVEYIQLYKIYWKIHPRTEDD